MDVVIKPRRLEGSVRPPASKSRLIRLILCAALAEGESRIDGAELCADTEAALRCAEALGASVRWEDGGLSVVGHAQTPTGVFDCGESASVLRFVMPPALALCGGGEFLCRGSLAARPMEPYRVLFPSLGIDWRQDGEIITVHGKLPGGDYVIDGGVSSQFVSGLLLALPLVGGSVSVSGNVRSLGYVALTGAVMELAGIRTERDGFRWSATGEYEPFRTEPERDWSNAAFFMAANALGSDIAVEGLNEHSAQPDSRMTEYCELLRAERDAVIDVSQNPDLLPPLAVMAAVREGRCRFTNAAALRFKESDRLRTVTENLTALGAEITELPDGLAVNGVQRLRGGEVNTHGDHRMAMMAAVAATVCDFDVRINGADCVEKSYPAFFRDYAALGGSVDVCI